jgi:bifunctional UDP-N-acetylglucosamine pyrophosphorylase/glucosamine-1-phosphate N-acetyltransferase
MDTATFGIVIMAAGKGTRLKSARPKVLHEIGGQALLLHVIAAAKTISDEIVCVIGHEAAQVEAVLKPQNISWTLQEQQLGTGHALQQVAHYYRVFAEGFEAKLPTHLLVLSGDVPLIQPETLQRLTAFHLAQHAAMTILTAVPPNPTGYGRVLRTTPGAPEVSAIIEQKDLKPGHDSPEINSGIYCFETAALFANLDRLSNRNASGEFYLTDIASLLVAEGKRVVAIQADSVDEVLGANTIAEMMHLDRAMNLATAKRLMSQGVTIFYPDSCRFDAQVQVGPDTIIEPYVQLLGNTRVGSNSRIASFSVAQDAQIGDHVLLRNGCIISGSTIANHAKIGPYAHIRPGSDIGESAHVGNFVETKKVKLGRNSKANHLSYLGDAVIGENTNIGAGVITANYDGTHKHQTNIGNNAFIGSDSTLIAPITVGNDTLIAAGSTITEDVPNESLAVARSRQTTKSGWIRTRTTKAKS